MKQLSQHVNYTNHNIRYFDQMSKITWFSEKIH